MNDTLIEMIGPVRACADTTSLQCSFGSIIVPATYVNSSYVTCLLPYIDSADLINISLSINGDDWTFAGNIDLITGCDIVITADSPPAFSLSYSNRIVDYTITKDCYYMPLSVMCIMDDDVTAATSVTDTTISCAVPSVTEAAVQEIIIQILLPGAEYNLTQTLIHYADPAPAYYSPDAAHVDITNITICGLTNTTWAAPRCLFSHDVFTTAIFITETCIQCPYYSSLSCGQDNDLVVSVYDDQYSTLGMPISRVCLPTVSGYSPSSVVIQDITTETVVTVTGTHYYDSDYLLCRYGTTTAEASWSSSATIQCSVPTNVTGIVLLQVSNDAQNWVDVSQFSFIPKCAAGYENNAAHECVLCPDNYYKSTVSVDDCTSCGDFMMTSCNDSTPCTDVSQCQCNSTYMSPTANYESCGCNVNYGYAYGACTACDAGYHKPTVSNAGCVVNTAFCSVYTPAAGYVICTTCSNRTIGAQCDVQCATAYDGTATDSVCDSDGHWTSTTGCVATVCDMTAAVSTVYVNDSTTTPIVIILSFGIDVALDTSGIVLTNAYIDNTAQYVDVYNTTFTISVIPTSNNTYMQAVTVNINTGAGVTRSGALSNGTWYYFISWDFCAANNGVYDCAGVCNGTAAYDDACSRCAGGNTTYTAGDCQSNSNVVDDDESFVQSTVGVLVMSAAGLLIVGGAAAVFMYKNKTKIHKKTPSDLTSWEASIELTSKSILDSITVVDTFTTAI